MLLLVNENSPVSREIGDDYAKKRHVKNILAIRCNDSAVKTDNETISYADYVELIEGIPVELETSKQFAGNRTNLAGYYSWGSNDSHYKAEAYQSLQFAPGSISDTAVSTCARTFLPTQGGQFLTADLIAHGLTAAKGYSDEPWLQANSSPTIVLDRYTSGYTMAESFYAGSRFVGWEDVIIGDPLCAPYRSK